MKTAWPHRVLIVSAPFLPRVGGVQNIARSLAQEFSTRGHEVTVMTSEPCNTADEFPFRVVRQPGLARVWREFTWADAVIQFGDGVRLGWPLLLKKFPVLTSHQIWGLDEKSESPLRRRLRRRMVRRSANVCCSRALAQKLDAPSAVVGNPYDEQLFRNLRLPRERDLVFVGRLIPEKGADLLLESLAMLQRQQIFPTATIVGDGPQRDELQRQSATLGLQAQVQFAGAVTGEPLVQLLNRHRVMVVPSRWEEPFGIVALEGLACGCAVVASDGGGLPDAVGSCGQLFRSGQAQDLAEQIICSLERPQQLTGENLAGHLHEFTSAKVAEHFLALLRAKFCPACG